MLAEDSILDADAAGDPEPARGAPVDRAGELAEERRRLLLAQRDPAAFRWLYDRYYLRICHFLRGLVQDRTVADDLTGHVFAQALAALPRYRWRGVSYGAYLHQVALNAARRHWRTRARWRPAAEDEAAPLADPRPDALSALVTAEREREVRAAIAGLSEAQRTVIAMHYWEELGVAEIAELLDEPEGTIKARLKRARDRLRLRLLRQAMQDAPAPAGFWNGMARRLGWERDVD